MRWPVVTCDSSESLFSVCHIRQKNLVHSYSKPRSMVSPVMSDLNLRTVYVIDCPRKSGAYTSARCHLPVPNWHDTSTACRPLDLKCALSV